MSDNINPEHYQRHPSGVECIEITEHMNFCLGNAVKYIWRAGLKGDAVQDLQKAAWYIEREIKRIESERMYDKLTVPPELTREIREKLEAGCISKKDQPKTDWQAPDFGIGV